MKKFNAYVLFMLFNCTISFPGLAANIIHADNAFLEKDYVTALAEYKKAAKIGNAKAFYQLSKIYHQGLGTEKNELLGIVWMAVAAEYQYDNAVVNLEKMQKSLAPNKRSKIETIINRYVQEYSKLSINEKFFPKLIDNKLAEKIQLSSDDSVEFFSEQNVTTAVDEPLDLSDDLLSEDGAEEDFAEDVSELPINMPYYLVAEYDIGPDGSVRDVYAAFSIGDDEYALEQLSITPVSKPVFAGSNVYFINRSIMGISNTDTISMRRNNTEFYTSTLRYVGKIKDSDQAVDNYNHALALMHFPWLRGKDETIDELLISSAKQGFALAQYEYGLKLYRQQTAPKQAVYWISEAAKQGITKAQYRLARLLLDSPWVERDINKAYFWLSQAALKKHTVAVRKLAELKLTTKGSSVYDPKGAMMLLNTIASEQSGNPEYRYALALAYAKPENRQFAYAVANLKKAISLAESFHWDTQDWRALLNKWTSGGTVTVTDI
ncbi:hypothetical protein RI844_14545 [Thalassotalea fonticola]|uniref:Sel1 repeat family protein n=1 Tax=Thalassotalea fonticola TaxID=3065649 RepID=A0ABZ0GLH2_9GAMM|nr:hypothetical protein RI844_14545 [Colwelliaceae bacterium S1-1]